MHTFGAAIGKGDERKSAVAVDSDALHFSELCGVMVVYTRKSLGNHFCSRFSKDMQGQGQMHS